MTLSAACRYGRHHADGGGLHGLRLRRPRRPRKLQLRGPRELQSSTGSARLARGCGQQWPLMAAATGSSRRDTIDACVCVVGAIAMAAFLVRPDAALYPAFIAAHFYILVVLVS
ncbi:hypothetical protein ONE63_006320 [Megalurothrips usitatus]|uniref:Uncharacterized protein n=1 Tax=Megalurothrips usitatus TaxID=439358 RepID=A0AAV7XT10_9NEOP|nr:hypothetical protein ONE63_006320 [Megalurothrips usitatus]